MTKKKIRSRILLKLKTQKEEYRNRKSKLVKDKLFRTLVFRRAKIILFYISLKGEVNTKEMIKEAQKLGKLIAVPVIKNKIDMKPCIYRKGAPLQKGPYGVPEPAIKKQVDLKKLNLVIVPGVAYDAAGNRLGRGKGCYDRFLSKLPAKVPTVGLAYDFQVLPSVPATKEDVKVKKIIFA